MAILISLIILLILLYLLALRGRKGHPGLEPLRGWYYAHRGLFGGHIPENSLAAFRAALDAGYGIELDVHLLKDGTLAILHDSDLKRVTGREGVIEDLTADDLADCHLNGTDQTIPTFSQVLELFQGRAPMIVELKPWKGNHAALCQAACRMLEGYSGVYCLESFDPQCVLWLKQNRPHLVRGQLCEDFLHRLKGKKPWLIRFLGTYHLQTFLTRPDFIACRFSDRRNLSNFLIRKLWGIQGVTWTVDREADFRQALQEGWIPIFESIRPAPQK